MTRAVDVASRELPPNTALGTRNLIINGDMRIAQRGTSTNRADSGFGYHVIDRFGAQAEDVDGSYDLEQSTDAPADFDYSMLVTVTGADSLADASDNHCVGQRIEGQNIAHLKWGTASAKTITISFWVKSSLTGTFGGALSNGINSTRAYGFTYDINATNTWEYKTVTIPGDTTGSWSTNNSIGVWVAWSLGANAGRATTAGEWSTISSRQATGVVGEDTIIGTLGATWQITGVQLEVGEEATEFEHRPYDMELSRCWRYFYSGYADGEYPGQAGANVSFQQGSQSTNSWCGIVVAPFPTQMRATPTVTPYSPNSGASGKFYSNNTGADLTANASGTTAGFKVSCQGNSPAAPFGMQVNFTAEAEL